MQTDHTHTWLVPGCFRCDLAQLEMNTELLGQTRPSGRPTTSQYSGHYEVLGDVELPIELPSDDCMLCGAHEPPGHVVVMDYFQAVRIGRICSSHTLRELLLDSQDRFLVSVSVAPN